MSAYIYLSDWRITIKTFLSCFVVYGFAALLGYAQQPARLTGDHTSGGGNLKIVVLHGDDGVNVRKGNIVAEPEVEVRDGWGVPLEGAKVSFELPAGKPSAKFANHKRVASVQTTANGRASAGKMRSEG